MPPPLIALEEHFFSSAVPPSLTTLYSEQLKHLPNVHANLLSLTTTRLTHMNAGGIALQIVSHAPGLSSCPPSASRAANDQLHAAITSPSAPNRLAGLAVLCMDSPPDAASELRRAVTSLHFVGALVDNTSSAGHFFDGPEYDIFWSAAEELDVPVYLHPTFPAPDAAQRYQGNYSDAAARSLASSGMGWHAETGMHVLRLFASGLFDRRPRLKVIVGHMGEMIPFMLERICVLSRRWGEYARDFRTVYRENIWITTSGVWSIDPMRCILANTPIDRILYSVDYPFQQNEVGLQWMRDLEESGLVDGEQLKAIAYGNAEKLLRVTAPKGEEWSS
ncbi:amidohydrolase [Podospora aff. communis PSN243]|uniref:Amidohydrolase n=1 Tax=Podospora aff. communis PSN243 TaxID=3040156 RepID=A0AAV9GV18_9PEZI|nr:amidohydrolase [Podospora aff. communis PSN243]